MDYRTQGTTALSSVLNNQRNIQIIEKTLYNQARSEENIESSYTEMLYQVIGDIIAGKNLKDIMASIKSGKLGWLHNVYDEWRRRMEEQDDFIEHPFEVVEGVLECRKVLKNGKICGSKRVHSYSKQVRGGDEPMTTFAQCCACGSKWSYSG
jgi:DNA-directed RNA polymerase subunit M/transcription elongation factor TFIIS